MSDSPNNFLRIITGCIAFPIILLCAMVSYLAALIIALAFSLFMLIVYVAFVLPIFFLIGCAEYALNNDKEILKTGLYVMLIDMLDSAGIWENLIIPPWKECIIPYFKRLYKKSGLKKSKETL